MGGRRTRNRKANVTEQETDASDVEKDDHPVPPTSQAAAGATKLKKTSQKKCVIIVATGVVVVVLVLAAILVGMYLFTEAEKDILQILFTLKDNKTQEISSNPNTNTVWFHVKEAGRDTWTVNDYNAGLKVVKIQTQTETNCYATPLNESSPTDLPNIKSTDVQTNTVGQASLSYYTNGSPIKDNTFLSKTVGDMCSGVSTYWLYPQCESPTENNASNTPGPWNNRQKRRVAYWAVCNGWYYISNCPFDYTCTYYPFDYNNYQCYQLTGSYECYIMNWWFTASSSPDWPYSCTMYKCGFYTVDYIYCPQA